MKTVEILEGFTAYPNDKERVFEKGETPELANDFAELIIEKRHAREAKPAAKEKGASE